MITVTIFRKTLVKLGACEKGLELFDTIAAGQGSTNVVSVEWTPLADVCLRAAQPAFSGWLFDKGLIPSVTLSGANLSGANLSGANLYGSYRGASSAPTGWVKDVGGHLTRSGGAT